VPDDRLRDPDEGAPRGSDEVRICSSRPAGDLVIDL
jgi:hypothetical protein